MRLPNSLTHTDTRTCAHQENGVRTCGTGMADSCGLMATHMKEAGRMTISPRAPKDLVCAYVCVSFIWWLCLYLCLFVM